MEVTRSQTQKMKKILVWDIPTRIGHWALAIVFFASFFTGDGEAHRLYHVATGYAVGGILIFRIYWGMAGTRYARFSSFLFSPIQAFGYLVDLLKGKPRHWIGHNPAGSYAIYLLILLGLATVATGAAVYIDIGGEWLEDAHDVLSYTMLGLVAIHIVGVIVGSWAHRENLARSMVNGYKVGRIEDAIGSARPFWAIGPIAAAVLASMLVFIS